ncbi:MAG: hypothetical protein LBK97_07570 [Prevotellaceae bacterium]|jgi:hypothetical protein|nr:hypothetical protein [Prevotellaceae bacterium]
MRILKLFSVFILSSLLLSCTNGELSTVADPLYEIVPNIANCTPGSLSEIEKQKVLAYINSVRTTHNLPAVEYDARKDNLAQDAALIGAANADISGTVTDLYKCYSKNAAQECANGNRSLWGSATAKWPSSEIHVNDWMTELNSGNINCRRRILDPFLKYITFGRIIGTAIKGEFKYVSSAMLIPGYGDVDLSEYNISYVAYPQGIYSAKLFDANSFLSFSVLHSINSKSSNGESNVDFSEATVEVSVGSQILDIVEGSISYDYNDDYGLPNSLQWQVQGLAKNVSYTVKIHNVIVAKNPTDYEYTFSFR